MYVIFSISFIFYQSELYFTPKRVKKDIFVSTSGDNDSMSNFIVQYHYAESWAKIIGRKHKTKGFVTEFIFYDTEFTERLCTVKHFDVLFSLG